MPRSEPWDHPLPSGRVSSSWASKSSMSSHDGDSLEAVLCNIERESEAHVETVAGIADAESLQWLAAEVRRRAYFSRFSGVPRGLDAFVRTFRYHVG